MENKDSRNGRKVNVYPIALKMINSQLSIYVFVVTHQLELFQEINIIYISKINYWTQTEQQIFLYEGPFHFLFKYLRHLICTQGKEKRRSKGLQNTGFRSTGDACFLPLNSSPLSFNLSLDIKLMKSGLNGLIWYGTVNHIELIVVLMLLSAWRTYGPLRNWPADGAAISNRWSKRSQYSANITRAIF